MAGSRSGRVEANWQALISAPPSEAAVSSTRFALRWCCNSQSRGCTREGNHFARSRRVVYPTKISAATVASTSARARDCPTGTTRVACSCTWSPASVQRKAFERARSARRTRNRAGLCVSPSAEKAAHVSSIACLTALSSIHCFFIVSPGSALLLPLSFLVLVFQRDFAHVILSAAKDQRTRSISAFSPRRDPMLARRRDRSPSPVLRPCATPVSLEYGCVSFFCTQQGGGKLEEKD